MFGGRCPSCGDYGLKLQDKVLAALGGAVQCWSCGSQLRCGRGVLERFVVNTLSGLACIMGGIVSLQTFSPLPLVAAAIATVVIRTLLPLGSDDSDAVARVGPLRERLRAKAARANAAMRSSVQSEALK
jgi:hypothetical protein